MQAMRIILVSAVLAALWLSAPASAQGPCSGFVLLDYRTQAEIANGQYRGWEGYLDGQPIPLSYQFDDEFMDFLGPQGRQAAKEAVIAALQSWSNATNGNLSFHESQWVAVENSDLTPFWQWEGPSFAQWEALGFPLDNLPGWGANMDFFTKPVGFMITSGDITYTMTPGILGFAVIYRAGDFIRSVDIYFNEAWSWSTSASQTAQASGNGFGDIEYACNSAARGVAHDHGSHGRPGDQGGVAGTGPVFDVQTVVLHEVGHALGLDHPNEAQANGGALIDPFTFAYLPGNCWQTSSVMHGDYNGLKRELKPADIGGMAFLYLPALAGDLDASQEIDAADAFLAIHLIGGDATPTPYEVNIMDFVERDGLIDDLETATVVQWAFGSALSETEPDWSQDPLQALSTALIVTPSFEPPVMTLGETSTLVLDLHNPNHRNIRMWTIEAEYDPAILTNPRVIDGTLFGGSIWVVPEFEPGRIRFARVALFEEENTTAGSVARLTFDVIGLPSPGGGKSTRDAIALTEARILVSDPVLHVFAANPGGETLIIHPLPTLFADLDVTGDGVVGTEDWYAFLDDPFDINDDGVTNPADQAVYLSLMRQTETADITTDLVVASPTIPGTIVD